MRKRFLLLLFVLGLLPLQADEYDYLCLHSPAPSCNCFYSINDLRKITFGNDAMQVYLKNQSVPVTWAYSNLWKMTFEAEDETSIKSIQKKSGLSIIQTMSEVRVESHSPLKSVTIYNLQGSCLALFGQGETSVSYSPDALPAGIYVVRAENAEDFQTIKFIKR